jgi:hypothetical protein
MVMNPQLVKLAQEAKLFPPDYKQNDAGYLLEKALDDFARLIISHNIESIGNLRGFSGYIDGKIVDTPKWNAAIEAAQEVLTRIYK